MLPRAATSAPLSVVSPSRHRSSAFECEPLCGREHASSTPMTVGCTCMLALDRRLQSRSAAGPPTRPTLWLHLRQLVALAAGCQLAEPLALRPMQTNLRVPEQCLSQLQDCFGMITNMIMCIGRRRCHENQIQYFNLNSNAGKLILYMTISLMCVCGTC